MIKLNSKINQNNISKFVELEIHSITALVSTQKTFSKHILVFLKNFLGNIDTELTLSNEANGLISDASMYLTKINKNIEDYNHLLDILDKLKENCSVVKFSETVNAVSSYNKEFETLSLSILRSNSDIERFILSMSSIDVSEYLSLEALDAIYKTESDNSETKKKNKTRTSKKNSETLVENTLTISETNKTVTLPYKMADLKALLRDNPDKYNSLSDVISDKYTIPISEYKFAALSRFREAYKLIINKEHGSKKQALNLACEMFSNYNLHPAVITACKNLNELDIYLSCLEFNELEDFRFFKVVYDVLPVVNKKANNEIIA